MLDDYNSYCNFSPGAERLIKHFSKNKIPMALATSSGEQSVKVKFSKHQDLYKLFHHVIMASSDPRVKRGKPAPDVFLVAASHFPDKPSPEKVFFFKLQIRHLLTHFLFKNVFLLKCLVFEDAPNGVQAANSAGMQVVMVPEDYVTQEDRDKATLVLKSLNDFKPELFGLPPFSD